MPNEDASQRKQRSSIDERIVAAARNERWVLCAGEFRAIGVSESAVHRRVKSGWLTVVFHGVHLVGRSKPTRDELHRAALKACDGLALGRRSAAVVHGVMERWDGPIEVHVAKKRRKQKGLLSLERDLAPNEITWRNGVPVATLAVVLCDLAEVLGPAELDRAVHEAEFRRKLKIAAVERAMARRPARPGYPALRAALAKRRRAVDGRLDSKLERRFHRFLEGRGYPPSEPSGGSPSCASPKRTSTTAPTSSTPSSAPPCAVVTNVPRAERKERASGRAAWGHRGPRRP